MKILIFSDAHGRSRGMEKALGMHPDAELVLFLGDGVSAARDVFKTLPARKVGICVHGNCDGPFSFGLADEEILDLEGHRILFCHGHRYGVKGGLGGLIAAARRKECDIALFGHTHEPYEEYLSEYRLWLFNPGSIAEPSHGDPTFGLLTLTPDSVLFSHGTVGE